MSLYRIKPGGSFKLPDGALKTAGDEIELDSDVAASHAHVLEPVAPPAPQASAPAVSTTFDQAAE